MSLDVAMPKWHRREHHRARTGAPAHRLLTAVEELTWSEVPIFRALMAIRMPGFGQRFAPNALVLKWFYDAGFAVLERTDQEIVFGTAQPAAGDPAPSPIVDPVGLAAFDRPGYVKIALDFRAEPGWLSTETRVLATDPRTRRRFAVYWALIRGFSGLIRREWLRAILRRAAEQDAAGGSGAA